MRGRPTIFKEQELLQKAQHVFWEKGYTATSLEDLLKAMEIGSGSFYNTFKGGKKELFSRAIQQRREAFAEFKAEVDTSASPLEVIKDFYRSLANADRQTHLQGCLIVNTVTEMTFVDQALEEEAVRVLKEVEQMYVDVIAKAQQDGTIKNQTSAAILGRYLITFWSGFNVTRRMYPDRAILKEQIEMQLSILS
ncbi:TetR/AcrR family transcriptional regulator [Flavobacterium sp. CLA17]|uniref:TetR/AcrR family transcriptional regulator n=1 Tax=Flavobacterium sp. CLA17 TaxID=2724135 RepID=UPI0014922A51|nr:TetR/AcrR family transcriptional regulator [Flavobacterium sp. CLA17]QSB29229.1 TetR/AcrR family transcriptional regulator [Flavobacterium sp. CLA17]